MKLSTKEFEKLCHDIFRKHGFNDEENNACTEEIIEAECRGRASHGAAIIPEIIEWKKAKAGKSVHGERGMVFVAIKCDLFVSKEKFLTDISKFVSDVKNSRKKPGFNEIYLPGERGDKLLEKAKKEGIEIDGKLYGELKKLSQ